LLFRSQPGAVLLAPTSARAASKLVASIIVQVGVDAVGVRQAINDPNGIMNPGKTPPVDDFSL
jgi:hypothetical protein